MKQDHEGDANQVAPGIAPSLGKIHLLGSPDATQLTLRKSARRHVTGGHRRKGLLDAKLELVSERCVDKAAARVVLRYVIPGLKLVAGGYE